MFVVVINVYESFGEINLGRANTVVWGGRPKILMDCVNWKCVLIAGLTLLLVERCPFYRGDSVEFSVEFLVKRDIGVCISVSSLEILEYLGIRF